jgi:hypothetical protein
MHMTSLTKTEIVEIAADYLSRAPYLKANSPASDYQITNRLAFLLALHLPSDLYRKVGAAVTSPSASSNSLTVISELRDWLGQSRDPLSPNEMFAHAPGAGKLKN